MAQKNSQILLIENVLGNLNNLINDQEQEINEFENENEKLKNTISTLKFECKTAFDEQEKLEETVLELKKQISTLNDQIKTKDEHLDIKEKELQTFKIQHEQFMENVEEKTSDLKKQLEDKNSIIKELQAMNKELSDRLHHTTKDGKNAISRLQRKLEQEEVRSFVNSKDSYDFETSKYKKIEAKLTPSLAAKHNPKLDKLHDKLKPSKKKEEKNINNTHVQTEEDILKRNLGF